MSSLTNLIGGILGILSMQDDYEDRAVGRDLVDGVTISTVYATDFDTWETALIDSSNTYIVERGYPTLQDAQDGHKRWIEVVKSGKRTFMDVGYGDLIRGREFTLLTVDTEDSDHSGYDA